MPRRPWATASGRNGPNQAQSASIWSRWRLPMHRSSESVAAIATALAKAQTELSNPEKALVGTVYNNRSDSPHSFRYASLSSGLDIVRKTLGGHQIAVAQTTDIDRAGGMVNLTTLLLHTSGEWISSDWPVCRLSETTAPRRMGAALTYARRYALFTLVGIAGEDDIDAADLCAEPNALSSTVPQRTLQPGNGNPPGQPQGPGDGRGRGSTKNEPRVVLDPAQSAKLRDKLLIEVQKITSVDLAATWAGEALVAKNSLTAADAKLVEDAFERELSELPSSDTAATSAHDSSVIRPAGSQDTVGAKAVAPDHTKGIDKSILTLAAPRRYRNREHLRYVMQQPCLVCGRKPSDPHHLRFTQPRALGRKVSDEFAVPLCRIHHRLVHRSRDERAWWRQTSVDPIQVARKLWKETRVNEGRVPPDAITQMPQIGVRLNSQPIGSTSPDSG